MDANPTKLGSISQAHTLKEMGEFWDTHDFTDYDDANAPDVEFRIAPADYFFPLDVPLETGRVWEE